MTMSDVSYLHVGDALVAVHRHPSEREQYADCVLRQMQ